MEQSKNPVIAGIIVIAVIAILVGAVIVLGKKDDASKDSVATPTSQSSTEQTKASDTSATTDTASTYKNGTYEAVGTYSSPGGTEKINVKITIADNAITDAEVTEGGTSRTSLQYQSEFIAGYKKQVVGKKVDEVELSKVSGSSLTPKGFNDALDDIRNEARG